jgi:hypothetical protein
MSIREPAPAPVETVDPQLAKLIMLTQLCSHVEGMNKKGKKKKKRFLDEMKHPMKIAIHHTTVIKMNLKI